MGRAGRESPRGFNAQSTRSSAPASFLLLPLLCCSSASETPSLYLQGSVLYCKLLVLVSITCSLSYDKALNIVSEVDLIMAVSE